VKPEQNNQTAIDGFQRNVEPTPKTRRLADMTNTTRKSAPAAAPAPAVEVAAKAGSRGKPLAAASAVEPTPVTVVIKPAKTVRVVKAPAAEPVVTKDAKTPKAAPVSVAAPAGPSAAVTAEPGVVMRRTPRKSVAVPQQAPIFDVAPPTYTSVIPSTPEHVPSQATVSSNTALANNWKNKTAEQMTDAELLAMPEAEYMNTLQMAYFRRKLVDLKTGILSLAGETTEHLREETVVVPDPADRATIEEEHALELRTRDRERKLLKKIEQSIGRIDSGDYGYCDETGEPIGVGRLLARPTATLSLEAQQRRELKQKMYGD
jgi:DnaK suppressor protein